MATTLLKFGPYQGAWVFGWDLASGETGLPAFVAPWPDMTVHVSGTFNGSSIKLEGALEEASPVYVTLRDLPGVQLATITANYCEAIQQSVVLIRPVALTVTAVKVRLKCYAARQLSS